MEFNNMDDEQFRKEFLRFISLYQRDMERFMRTYYGNRNPYENLRPEDLFNKLGINLNDMDFDKGINDDGSAWESKSWNSPDGLTNFRSFTQKFGMENPREVNTIDLLKEKLNIAVMNEEYEKAAKIKKLMDSLTEDKVKKN